MEKLDEKEENALLQKNPHLKKYIEKIEKKSGRPDIYAHLPFEVRDEKNPIDAS